MKTLLISVLFTLQVFAHPDQLIGEDDRHQVTDLSDPVHESIGMVEFEGHPGGYCTGSLISPRHVLTNGHCVIREMKFPATLRDPGTMKFTPGRLAAGDAPHGTIYGRRIFAHRGWVQGGNSAYDFAVIELQSAFPLTPLVLQAQASVESLEGQGLTLAGYSFEKAFGTLWEGRGTFERPFNNGLSFLHSIDAMHGTSGGLIRKARGNSWVGVALHRGDITFNQSKEKFNEAVLISPSVLNQIKAWMTK